VKLETYGFAAVPSEIRALFDHQKLPEGSWDWFEVLATTTLSEREEAVLVALIDVQGHPLAAMPLVLSGGQLTRGLTSPFTTLFCAPLGSRESARRFGRLLAGKAGGKLRLDALDGGEPAIQGLQEGLSAGGLVVLNFRHFANWFERIPAFPTYWESRPSTLKATVKRKSAPLLRDKRLAFELMDLAGQGPEGRATYDAIYAKSWKPAEPHPHFIDVLLEKLGPSGRAKLAVARIDGMPAAAQIWLVQDGRATIFKLAHDPAFDRHSPGTLLTHWLLRRLQEEEGVSEVDFGRGDDSYKQLWLGYSRDRQGILAANPRRLRGLAAIIFDILPSKFVKNLRSAGRPAQKAEDTGS